MVDTIYIDNAIYAYLLAADHIDIRSSWVEEVCFITNDEPLLMSDLINRILNAINIPEFNKTAPASLLCLMG